MLPADTEKAHGHHNDGLFHTQIGRTVMIQKSEGSVMFPRLFESGRMGRLGK
jgi:hypothetical protein